MNLMKIYHWRRIIVFVYVIRFNYNYCCCSFLLSTVCLYARWKVLATVQLIWIRTIINYIRGHNFALISVYEKLRTVPQATEVHITTFILMIACHHPDSTIDEAYLRPNSTHGTLVCNFLFICIFIINLNVQLWAEYKCKSFE